MTERAGQRDIPVLDITLATPLEGVESLKDTGAFDSKRQRIAYNVSFLDGGGESIKVRGAGGRGNRFSFFVKYEDPSQWRDEGESGDAFIRAFTETAEAQGRIPSPQLFLKPSELDPRLSAPKTTTHQTPNELGPRQSALKTTTRRRRHTFPGTPPFSRPPPRRTHFGRSQTPHTFVRFVLLLSETNGGAGSSSSCARDFSVQAAEGQPCAALLALSHALFGRCSLSLIQLYARACVWGCVCVCVCVFFFFLFLAVIL
jgi:hypothetical protein